MQLSEELRVTGTLVWYYSICHRQVWLMSRQLVPEQENDNVVIGRWLHEQSYSRERHEVSLGNIKIDLIHSGKGKTLVGEIKKSSKSEAAARLQLQYYLYELRRRYGLDLNGLLLFPEERKREKIVLDSTAAAAVERAVTEIRNIIKSDIPPPPRKTRWCRPCAYRDFCWA